MNVFIFRLCRQPKGSRQNMALCDPGEVIYVPFPYFHLGGIYMGLFWPLVQGAKIICMPKYNNDEFLHNIHTYRVLCAENNVKIINKMAIMDFQISYLILPPPIQVFLAKSELVDEYDLRSIKTILCGAAPVSKETAEEVAERIPSISNIVQSKHCILLIFIF